MAKGDKGFSLSWADAPKYLAEFVGTYVLVLTVGCNVLGGTPVWAVTSIATALMVGVYSLGSVSGAHLNPAVTLAILLTNKMPGGWQQAVVYMATQIVGGVCAGLTYLSIFHSAFDLGPGKGHNWMAAGAVEFLYTFMLAFTVLNCACSSASAGNQYYGLAIGYVVVAGGYAVGTVSGAAFNPAVAFGVDMASVHKGFGYSALYLCFQFAGAALAAGAFRFVRAEDFGGQKNGIQAKLIAEFIGTYMLVCTVGFNVLSGSTAGAWSIAAALMCGIYAVGNVSGAHLNPAVTLAVLLSGRGKIDNKTAVQYMATQVVAAICGAFTYTSVLNSSFKVAPGIGMGWAKVGVADVLFTCLLCFVVLSVATTEKPSRDMFGLAIGSVITAAGFAGASIGIGLNPAVCIGADFVNMTKNGGFGSSLAYTGFEFVGAGLACGLFRAMRPQEYGKVGV